MSDKEIFFSRLYCGECRKLFASKETTITELPDNQEKADYKIMFRINDGVIHGFQLMQLTRLTQMVL